MKDSEDTLAFLLHLNLELAAAEERGEQILPPGLPQSVTNPSEFASHDCLEVAGIGVP